MWEELQKHYDEKNKQLLAGTMMKSLKKKAERDVWNIKIKKHSTMIAFVK